MANLKDEDNPGAVDAQEERDLALLSMMMRLYDLELAILGRLDKLVDDGRMLSDEVFDMHAAGGHNNPPIFIPTPRSEA